MVAPAARPIAGASGERLVYVSDEMPGLTRQRRGRGFVYRRPDGSLLRDAGELQRIRSLAIPPAYTRVWICTQAHGHLQATGRDARGRKQYRYHVAWRQARDGEKFDRLPVFAAALPRLRARVARDLVAQGPGLAREAVLAAVVRLLDTTLVRVGNDAYARENGSFGLTTLRSRHAELDGSRLRLRFRGKSGVSHEVALDDPRLARVVRRCQALPGQELFQYLDDAGEPQPVGSTEVNDYLRRVTGEDITAKDFRTWHASVMALALARGLERPASVRAQRSVARALLAEVARRLGNTVTVCRQAYVHPEVLAVVNGERDAVDAAPCRTARLSADECRLLAFLADGRAGSAASAVSATGGGRRC